MPALLTNSLLLVGIILSLSIVIVGCSSGVTSNVGLKSNKLQECPSSPNCAQSEYPDDKDHYFEAIQFQNEFTDSTYLKIAKIVESMGGEIITKNPTYMHSTFTSSLFRFVDDFEVRISANEKTIHFRSASRVGYSDMGVNGKRVEEFRSKVSLALQ